MFHRDDLQRSEEEIVELCREMRESITAKSHQYDELSYEDGVIATLRWLFFMSSTIPSDVSDRKRLDEIVQNVKREILENDRAQAREGSDA